MYGNLVAIDKEAHSNLKFSGVKDFTFASENNSILLGISELAQAARDLPILFIQTPGDGSQLCPVALMGITSDTNSFVSDDGKWKARYIPATFRAYPFALVPSGDKENPLALAYDEESGLLSEGEGTPLFEENEEGKTLVSQMTDFLSQINGEIEKSIQFSAYLAQNELLKPITINVKQGEEEHSVEGFYVVDEPKLKELKEEKVLELWKAGVVPAIYSHLISMQNLQTLTS